VGARAVKSILRIRNSREIGIVSPELPKALEAQYRDAAEKNRELSEMLRPLEGVPPEATSNPYLIAAQVAMVFAGPAAELDAAFYDSLADNCRGEQIIACKLLIIPFCCPETAKKYCADQM